jgi:hypothetical protein
MFGVPRTLRANVDTAAGDADLAGIEQRIHGILERERRQTAVPGFSAAFALPDGRVGAAVAGLADFLVGSIGKTLHARDVAMASRSEMRTTGIPARPASAARAPGSGPISSGTPD